jgi:hypothetical protein
VARKDIMKPSEISLFTTKEQTLLVDTEPARLAELSEDELSALLSRVRRGRNKYSDLHRSQGLEAVRSAGQRYAATASNSRTLRKAEIFEDAVSRVARYLSKAARASATVLKDQRLADARAAKGGGPAYVPKGSKGKRPAGTKSSKKASAVVSGRKVGASSASNKRNQAKRDNRGSKSR